MKEKNPYKIHPFIFSVLTFLLIFTSHFPSVASNKSRLPINENHVDESNGLSRHSNSSKVNNLHNKNATFLSILTDSSSTGGKLIAEVVNHEVSPAAYTVHLMSCSDNIPVTRIELEPAIQKSLPHISNLSRKISHVDLTPPQRARVFIINLNFKNEDKTHTKLTGKATCLVSILNRFNKKLATKLVVFSPGDSCVCAVSCICSCHKEDEILGCKPIDDEKEAEDWLKKHNNRTTINKSPNTETSTVNPNRTFWDDHQIKIFPDDTFSKLDEIFKNLDTNSVRYLALYFVIIALLILLILGTLKGLFGIWCFPIGRFGLSHFYDKPRLLKKYWERRYSKYAVLYDSVGYPLDPLTRERTVQRLNPIKAFLLSVIFFLCWPIFFLYWLKDRCCPSEEDENRKSFGGLSREPHITRSDYSGRRGSFPQTNDSKVHPAQSNGSRTNVRRSSIETSEFSKLLESMTDDGNLMLDNDVNFVPVFDNSEPQVNERRYTAGYAHVYPNNSESRSILTPIPDSATLLQQLNRVPEQGTDTGEDRRRLRGNDNGNLREGPCCQDHPYGSWHRAPAIFADDYDGDSRFDMNKTNELSRRRRLSGKDDNLVTSNFLR